MSSLDESVSGESSAALLPFRRVPDELKGSPWQRAMDNVIPSAYAATCWEPTFSACSATGVRTKDFGGCMIGGATLEGTVTLTFNQPLCTVLTAGDMVTRTADLTLTGRYGGTLEITSPGGGQTLTKTADGFEYSVGGMERVVTDGGRPHAVRRRDAHDRADRRDRQLARGPEDRVGQLRDRSQGRRLHGHADRRATWPGRAAATARRRARSAASSAAASTTARPRR